MSMRKGEVILALAFLAAFGNIVFAANPNAWQKSFGCASVNCATENVSGTTCSLINCSTFPDFIINQTNITVVNQTNITVENITIYNITDCSSTELVKYIQNYSSWINQNFNFSDRYHECDDSRRTCVSELAESSSALTGMQGNCVNVSTYQTALFLANQTETKMQGDITSAQKTGTIQAIVIAIIVYAGIWFFKLRKIEIRANNVRPATGEHAYNPDALDKDRKITMLQAERDSLKEMIGKGSNLPSRLSSQPKIIPKKSAGKKSRTGAADSEEVDF